MKRRPFMRLLAMLLAMLMLSACGAAKKSADVVEKADDTESTSTEPTVKEMEQQEMPREELDKALADIDLSVLCAGFEAVQRMEKLENPYRVMQAQVVCTDYNQDGYRDLLLGQTYELTFSLYPQRTVDYTFVQSPSSYYTDDAGNLYRYNGLSDGFDIEVDGKPAWVDHMNIWYEQWIDGDWQNVYSYKGTITYVDEMGPDGQTVAKEIENTVVAQIGDQEGTKAQLDAYFEQINMRKLTVRPSAYIRNEYDVAYRDSLLAGLDSYLAQNYATYRQMLTQDIDNDGVEETVFLIPDLEEPWYNSLRNMSPYDSLEGAQQWFRSTFSDNYSHTGVVIADVENDKLVFTAHCALEYISGDIGMNIRIENGFLWLDNYCMYLNGRFGGIASSDVPAAIVEYMADYGYSDHFFRLVDVSDIEGSEYMCICRKDGNWYVFIIVIINGNPVTIYNMELGDQAIYLAEWEGKQYLLTYYQSIYTSGAETNTHYNFSVDRIKADGQMDNLVYSYINYTDKDLDATQVSAFFDKLNVYMIKIIVIHDTYQLTGKLWMDQEDVEFGSVPQEEPEQNQPEQNPDQEPVLGFVQIQDPSSWLNLRVGPGVEYDKVLMDPSDPNSFVRQALGSPVTVLETIETDDPENPVWLKVRITYADREFVGYSSKTYIRMVNE